MTLLKPPPADLPDLQAFIREVPDFPKPGILFRDISPLLRLRFEETVTAFMAALPSDHVQQAEAFAGIDSRGFIFAAAFAQKLRKNMVLVRKSGKLPPPVVQKSLKLEYGEATLEMTPGSGKVMVIDDVLATGGTLLAAAQLCEEAGYTVLGCAALIDLSFLNQFKWKGQKASALFTYT